MSNPDASSPEQPDEASGSSGLNFSQQQAKITALKELVRQTEATKGKRTASAQEKAKNIAQRLTHLKSKSSRTKHGDTVLTEVHEESSSTNTSAVYSTTTTTTTITSSDAVFADGSITHEQITSTVAPPFQRADSLPASAQHSTHVVPPNVRSGSVASRPETPGSEKIQLLRRQMEQNRARMVEREHSKRDIEQLVTQLKAKFDSSQMLDRSTSSMNLGRSIGDLSSGHHTGGDQYKSGPVHGRRQHDRFQSSADLSGGVAGVAPPHNFDRERIRYLEKRCADLERQAADREAAFVERNVPAEQAQRMRDRDAEIIDLREQLREKDSLIEARTQAVGVVSEMGRSAEDELLDTRQEWQESQRRFAAAEEELRGQLAVQAERIANLEQANEILERARFELTVTAAQMEGNQAEGGPEFSTKLGELQRLNETLQRRIVSLEEAAGEREEPAVSDARPTAELQAVVELTVRVEELAATIERLQQENEELKSWNSTTPADDSAAERLSALQAETETYRATIERLDGELQEKTAECAVLTASCAVLQEKLKSAAPKSLFSTAVDVAEASAAAPESSGGDVHRLNQQLDEANKSAIKTKLKMRQLQKQIDALRKTDETARHVGELTEANEALRQRVRELEELAAEQPLREGADDRVAVLETTCHNQIEAIRLLEEQKAEMTDDLQSTREELTTLRAQAQTADELDRSAHVASHMEEIVREETLDAHRATIVELQTKIAAGQAEREALTERLNHYVAENMELLDKWDKLNKGSSAESIEIVENLTVSERLEMEAIERRAAAGLLSSSSSRGGANSDRSDNTNATADESSSGATMVEQSASSSSTLTMAGLGGDEDGAGETDSSAMSQDLSDSLVRLREESSELMERIEAFTGERREVLDKMEVLQAENGRLVAEVAELRAEQERLHGEREAGETERDRLTLSLQTAEEERLRLTANVQELQATRQELCAEIEASVKRPSEPVQFCGDVYEQSLKSLEALLEGYRRGKDKNAKFDVSKRLAKETKNNVELVQRLLGEHVAIVERVNELQAQLDADQGAKPEQTNVVQQQLDSELIAARAAIEEREREIADLRLELVKELQNNTERSDRLSATEDEREIYKKLAAELKEEITNVQATVDEQASEIERLQVPSSNVAHVAELNDKMVALMQLFEQNNTQLEEQAKELANRKATIDSLNAQLMDVCGSMEEAAAQQAAKDDELSYLQEIIDANREEVRTLTERLHEGEANVRRLEATVEEQLREICVLQDKMKSNVDAAANDRKTDADVAALRDQIGDLEARNREQLEKLKKFAANLKKKNVQCAELVEKVAQLEQNPTATTTADAGAENEQLRLQIAAIEAELCEKSAEIGRLQAASIDSNRLVDLTETLNERTTENVALSEQLRDLRQENHSLNELLTSRMANIAALTEQLRGFEDANEELSSSLATSTSAQSEIVDKHAAVVAALTAQNNELTTKCTHLESHLQQQTVELGSVRLSLDTTASDLRDNHIKIEKCKTIIREKNRELKRLQEQVADLQTAVGQQQQSNVSAEQFAQLQLDLEQREQLVGSQALKLTEHEHFIETLRADKAQLQTRLAQLEENCGQAEERAAQQTAAAATFTEQLRELTQRAENSAEQHRIELQTRDDRARNTESKLEDSETARDELRATLCETQDDVAMWTSRAQDTAARLAAVESEHQRCTEEIARLTSETVRLHDELRRSSADSAAALAAKHSEIDTLENDLSAQLQQLDAERRRLQDDYDRTQDAHQELLAETVRLKEHITALEQTGAELERDAGWLRLQNEGMQQDQVEVQELRMQCVHDQTEIENLQTQTQQLVQTHDAEVAALRQQLAELDSLRTQIGQNQTDDQMCIQNENERLQQRLATAEAELVQYQRQNLQLQMAGGAAAASGTAALFALTAETASVAATASSDSEKLQLHEQIRDLQARLAAAVRDSQTLQDQTDELKAEQQEHAVEVEKLRRLTVELAALQQNIDVAQTENAHKEAKIRELQAIIDRQPQEEAIVARTAHSSQSSAVPVAATPVDDSAELRRNVAHLEQYINDLQIQLRIATNDCEQLGHTQQSLEEEIQHRTRQFEQRIDELQVQLQQQQPIASSALSSIESQIIPQAAVASTSAAGAAAVPSFDGAMFFGQTTASAAGTFDSLLQQQQLLPEPPIVPKTAYVCHDGSDADDGWGFGSDEAALEEQHQQQQHAPSAAAAGQLQVLQLQVADLTAEAERLRTENAALQVKSAKMLKKLKEYKGRNDELVAQQQAPFTKSGSADSSDLDAAIQEELNTQIRTLETRLREARAEQEKEQLERQSLLKRVDVLTAANERLTEMKERQDSDMDACRLRQRQLQQQLDQMNQWHDNDDAEVVAVAAPDVAAAATGTDPSAQPPAENLLEQLDQLRRQCADLQTDNAELQAIVDAEKEQTARLEQRIQRLSDSDETSELRAANQRLEAQTAQLSARLGESVATIDTLSVESANIRTHLEQLRTEHQLKIEENRTLGQQFRAMTEQLSAMQQSLHESQQPATQATANEEQLERQCEQLQATLQCREAEVEHLNRQLLDAGRLVEQTAPLQQERDAQSLEVAALKVTVAELRQQIEEQHTRVDSVAGDADLRANNLRLAAELAELQDEKRQMEHELTVLNDQVISTLNLEDDMRSLRLQMDARTIENANLKSTVVQLQKQQQEEQHKHQQQQEEQQQQPTSPVDLEVHTARLNAHWEHVLEQRCAELAESWRQHMSAREDEFAAQLARHPVVESAAQTSSAPSPSSSPERSIVGGADADRVLAMQQALETQEMEIVTLKEQLAIRSAEYARLASQVEPFGARRKSPPAAQQQQQRREPNQRSELDLALYMLHQRDMRCEELTEELMSMLAERDSLQMKLAGSMRQIERLRVLAPEEQQAEVLSDVDSANITPDRHPQGSDEAPTRHKTLRDEREQRQRQMAILQRDVATLPAEAVAELMGADYDATAEAENRRQPAAAAADESPYTALLNLFWGPRAPAPDSAES